MNKLVNIKKYSYNAEAVMAKELLENNGIKAIVSGTYTAGPQLEISMGIKLEVDEKDKEKAIEILGAYESKNP